jgi:hypothetical protein
MVATFAKDSHFGSPLRLFLSSGRFTMLPPFIIEQIRRREEQERARHEQPRLEIPTDRPAPRAPQAPEEQVDRGVVIIDLMNED